jgi:hypothetical protein
MEFRILNKNFIDLVLLDRYESLLWVDRYNECGDFELYTPPTDELIEACQLGNYIYSKDSEHLMIIEHVELTQSFDEGKKIIIKGRSIESILDRRILWYKTQFRKNLEDGIRQILDYSIITAPDDADRKIDNFVFEYSNDPAINEYIVDKEFDIGTDLLTVISELCKVVNLGFKITLNSNNQFVFKLYRGANRSYSQYTNPWVVFSNRFENLITNQFTDDFKEYKNTVRTIGEKHGDHAVPDFIKYSNEKKNLLVLDGEDYQIVDSEQFAFTCTKLKTNTKYTFTSKVKVNEGSTTTINCKLTGAAPYTRIYADQNLEIQNGRIRGVLNVVPPDPSYDDCMYLWVYSGSGNIITLTRPIFTLGEDEIKISGLERREVFNDASGTEYTKEMKQNYDLYLAQLEESAYDTLDSKIVKTEVNGTVEDKVSYEYNKDYFIGDIVQVENEFGLLGTMRVTEFITSHSTSGLEMYPTFKTTTGGEANDSI